MSVSGAFRPPLATVIPVSKSRPLATGFPAVTS